MAQLMNYMSGGSKPDPATLATDVNLDRIRKFLETVVTDAQQWESLPKAPQTVGPYIDSIISSSPLPTMHSPVSDETLLHMIAAAGSSAALMASIHPVSLATAIPLYFLVIGGTRIVVGAADGIAIALREGISTILLKWMGVPRPRTPKKSVRGERRTKN
jgi:hypothetical protein